jgi:hypothetical protein
MAVGTNVSTYRRLLIAGRIACAEPLALVMHAPLQAIRSWSEHPVNLM